MQHHWVLHGRIAISLFSSREGTFLTFFIQAKAIKLCLLILYYSSQTNYLWHRSWNILFPKQPYLTGLFIGTFSHKVHIISVFIVLITSESFLTVFWCPAEIEKCMMAVACKTWVNYHVMWYMWTSRGNTFLATILPSLSLVTAFIPLRLRRGMKHSLTLFL